MGAVESCAQEQEKVYYSNDNPASNREEEHTQETNTSVSRNHVSESTEALKINPRNGEDNSGRSEKTEIENSSEAVESDENPVNKPKAEPQKKAFPEIRKEKVSGLSLKSIGKKKELAEQQKANMPVEKVMDDDFTEEDLVAEWKNYTENLKRKGEKILASIFESQTPTLQNREVHLTFPNETMKLDLEREENRLMTFLKAKLRNTHISLVIHVDEAISRKYAFTPQEKYEKLKEANPLLDKLRATFDLDV